MNSPGGAGILYRGRHLSLCQRQGWEYASRHGASGVVGIVALTPDGRIVLVEQERIPVGCPVIELPAGVAGDLPGAENEPTETAARRELLEETGYQAAELVRLASGPSSPGLTSEVVELYLARDVVRVSGGGGDGHEQIVVHEVPVSGLPDWLAAQEARGALVDFKIHAAMYLLSTRPA